MESPPRRPPASVRRLWSQPNSARGPPAGSRVPNTPPSNVPSLYDLDSSLPLTARGSLRAAAAPVDHVTIYPNGDDNTRECVLSPQLQSADPLAVPVATLQQQTRAGDEVRCTLGAAAAEAERADHPAELSQHAKARSYVYPASAPLAPAPAPYSASHTTRAPQASKAEAVVSKTIAPTAAGSLSSRYTLHSLLGSGSHGSVYSATDTATGAEVAIKTLHLTHRDEGAPVTALREAVLLKQLKHPHVLPLLDVAMTEQEVCLVFERMDIDLSGYLDAVSRAHPQSSSPLPFVPSSSRSSGLDLYTIKSLTYQLLLAVAYCHRSHVVHRDIKPHNILLSASGLLKLADFGVARSVAVPSKGAVAEVTTLWYRAPELLSPRCALAAPEVPFSASTTGAAYAPSHEGVEGRYSCSISIDMWSVGCVLGELACGVPLFAAGTPLELGKRIEELLGRGAAGVPESDLSTTSTGNGPASSERLSVSPAPLPISPPVGPYTRTRARARIGAAFPSLGAAGADLLSVLLDPDPAQRITAKKALLHPFFDDIRVVSKAACSAAQAVASAVSSAETVTTGHVQSEAQCACECARVQEPACGCERGRGPGPVARVLSSVLTASAAVGARVMVPPDPHNPQPQTQPQIEAQAQAQVQTQRAHTPASLASSVALAAPTVGHRAGSTYTRTTAPAVRTSSSASAEGMAVTGWSALPVPIPSPVLENDAEYCSFNNCQLPSHHHQRQQQQQEREVPEYDQEQWESRYVNVPLQTKPRPSSGYAHPLHHPQGEETPPLIVRTPSSAPSSSALSSPVAVRASATPSTSSAASTARTRPISPAFTAIQAAVPVVFPGRAATPNVDTTAGNRARTHGAGGGSARAHGHLDIAWPSPGPSACAVSRGGSVPVSPASALRSLALHHIARSEQPKQQQQQQVLPRSNSLGAFPWLPLPPSALLSLVIAAISLMAAGYLHADATEKSETPSGHDSSCGEDTWPSTPSGRARVAAAALHSLGRSDPLLHAAAIAAALALGGPDAMRPYECHAHHTHEHARGQGRTCQCAGKAEGATCVWTRPVTVGDTVCDTPTAGVADPGETGSVAGSSSACACACACGRSCRRGASHSPHCHSAHARAHGPSSGRRVAVRYGTSVRLGASFRHVLRAVTRLARVTRADFALLM